MPKTKAVVKQPEGTTEGDAGTVKGVVRSKSVNFDAEAWAASLKEKAIVAVVAAVAVAVAVVVVVGGVVVVGCVVVAVAVNLETAAYHTP